MYCGTFPAVPPVSRRPCCSIMHQLLLQAGVDRGSLPIPSYNVCAVLYLPGVLLLFTHTCTPAHLPAHTHTFTHTPPATHPPLPGYWVWLLTSRQEEGKNGNGIHVPNYVPGVVDE